jgi:hypothetical protein
MTLYQVWCSESWVRRRLKGIGDFSGGILRLFSLLDLWRYHEFSSEELRTIFISVAEFYSHMFRVKLADSNKISVSL